MAIRAHRPGEEATMGRYVFGSPPAQHIPESNWSLLAELCCTRDVVIANTFFDEPAERQITGNDICSSPSSPVTHNRFGQIDFSVVSSSWLGSVHRVWSNTSRALASHDFLISASVTIKVPKKEPREDRKRRDVIALQEPDVDRIFADSAPTCGPSTSGQRAPKS